jgi:hypothetical protein
MAGGSPVLEIWAESQESEIIGRRRGLSRALESYSIFLLAPKSTKTFKLFSDSSSFLHLPHIFSITTNSRNGFPRASSNAAGDFLQRAA